MTWKYDIKCGAIKMSTLKYCSIGNSVLKHKKKLDNYPEMTIKLKLSYQLVPTEYDNTQYII
jgi:hypothetical protein